MVLNDRKRQYIDKEIFNILELLEEKDFKKLDKEGEEKANGSLSQKAALDLTKMLVDAPMIMGETDYFGVISKYECYRNKCIGLNQENYKRLIKLANTIYQEKTIKNIISKEYIEEEIFKWLLLTYKAKKVEYIFSIFLIEGMEKSLKNLKFHFPILYLDIHEPFCIGNVFFSFFTKNYLDQLDEYQKNKNSENHNNSFEKLKQDYQGKVFASYVIKAEYKKGQEIAYEHCSLAVDILKMCSETTDFPYVELGFDIDSRVNINPQNETIVCDAENELEGFTVTRSRPKHYHKINEQEWERICRRQVGDFHKFLLSITADLTELQQLIINGIKRYGNAISNKNQHQRVVELFTILESLLLVDQNSPIIESVCKYCSKLVFKLPEDRKNLINLLKSMYEVRSSLIHHGKEKNFETNNLRQLQYIVIMLLSVLVSKSEVHKTKQSLLQEIENAILNAY